MPTTFPTSLSPSRASDFMTCPLLFRFRSIDRLPEDPSPAAVRGTLVHRVLELLFDLPASERTLDATPALTATAFAELQESEPEAAAVVADASGAVAVEPYLEQYFRMEDPQRLEPHARELGLSVEIGDSFSLRGIIDRVDTAPDGAVRIVDYKTGRAPSAAFEGKAMFQMRFYALAWWRMTGTIPRRLQLMYLTDGQSLRAEPDESELVATERKILALREAIGRAAETQDFAPRTSRLCDWCSHRSLCPAWDGTPPPFPAGALE